MNMAKTYYITTAIDYVNAEPHIGHAYQKIVADALARYHKIKGEEVFYLTGTDEHGKKVQEAAEKAKLKPKEFVDKISKKFKEAWKSLNIEYDRFIRTTDADHEKVVKEFIKKVNENGDIYKGNYEGFYCTGCEQFYTEAECPDLICPIHKRKLEKIKEESYFFKLSKYQKFLLDLYKKHPEFIQPASRRNEIISRVKQGLKDLSITRTSFDWGIKFPLDKKHIVYVWFDALINYYTPIKNNKEKFWPADAHLLGKDNTWFHTVYWPAMLKSAGIPLPKATLNHGFLSFNGQKISKSLGNAISPKTLVEKYSADSVRYFCLRQFPFAEGNDGDFDEQALINRHNNELANKLGNLVSRVSSLAEKYGVKKTENKLLKKLKLKPLEKYFEKYEIDKALNEIFAFIDVCNEYIQKNKIWETKDTKKLYELADSIKAIAILLYPITPETSEKISKHFNFKISLDEISKLLKESKIKKAPILFQKIEQKINKQPEVKEIMEESNLATVEFEDFSKLDLRVAQIKNVEDIPEADKLYKLTLDVGESKERTICAGLKEFYPKEKLQDKKIIIISNLAPRKMRGILSEGMLLAASTKNHKKVVLLTPDEDIENGSKVS